MELSQAKAIALAMAKVELGRAASDETLAVNDEAIRETNAAWYFTVNSVQFLLSGDILDSLIGVGLIAISKKGLAPELFASGWSYEQVVEQYETRHS